MSPRASSHCNQPPRFSRARVVESRWRDILIQDGAVRGSDVNNVVYAYNLLGKRFRQDVELGEFDRLWQKGRGMEV